jgi:uncharacterized membrane protein YcaP (DUF421 family)
MFSILRGAAIYFFLLIIFRIAGKRTLQNISTFDFVLLLIISEVVQQAMIANDNSMINAFLLVITLVGLDIGLSLVKRRSERIARWVDSLPLLLIENGRIMHERMEMLRVDENDILAKARELRGLERLDQIKYAILENNGGITIVPKEEEKKG